MQGRGGTVCSARSCVTADPNWDSSSIRMQGGAKLHLLRLCAATRDFGSIEKKR
eukprot:CAMPEP_0119392352 /NCGR_PEP_ID=MMETSP1334-20130426/120805_1 /TAXON_ID=127549 /ORGANISM="Calcidiscus leptoporus, Strain RCC1130" /LENGTH=53 /DNA_ID=CAMNT_0007415195 /DNA_START=485 /DNA_END=642 /DNA_ORIENTATION=-